MTVINAMQFDSKSGGMVADSQGSSQLRKYDISEKICYLNGSNGTKILLGGAGGSSTLYETRQRIAAKFPNEGSFRMSEVISSLADIFNELGRDIIDKEMHGRFGFGAHEYIAGRLADGTPIGQHLLAPVGEVYLGRDPEIKEARMNGFLALGKDESGISLYCLPMGERPFLSPTPYGSIGSGRDESDKVLYGFVKNLPRDGRHSIDIVDGMAALIRATNRSSDINQGVGGIPTVAYFDDKKLVVLGENESLFATELVKVGDSGLVNIDVVKSGLGKLLGNTDSSLIEEELFTNQPNSIEIMRFLRGYRLNGQKR